MTVVNGTTGIDKVQDNSVNALTDIVSSSGIGYKTGDGVSVTQLTSKSTPVTLNKPCGIITLNNAALAAGASVQFTLNNTLINPSDLLVVNVGGGASIANYNLHASAGVGAAYIVVKNISAGSLSEAILVRFAVIKAAGA